MKWRWFCRIYAQPVPSDSTQQAREALIRPDTLQHLNQRLLRLAHAEGVTQGRKLRMDGTVIETHIHYPTDSRLLADSARVLGRLLTQARKLLDPRTVADKQLFRNRARRAKRLARQIGQQVRPKKGQKVPENKAQRTYRRLLKVVQALLQQVAQVEPRLRAEGSKRAIQLAESSGALRAIGPPGDCPNHPPRAGRPAGGRPGQAGEPVRATHGHYSARQECAERDRVWSQVVV